jgi:diguanylate cyclase (GGDEF)-like protein
MNIKNSKINISASQRRELENLRILLRDLAEKDSDCNPNEVMAVTRFFTGISSEEWSEIVEKYGLEQWLPVQLSGSVAEIWKHWSCLLEDISFQRDHDVLTGLYNRRYFERELPLQVARSERSGSDLSLVMFDLDRFKNVNDNYGHAKGDEVLAYLGKVLQAGKRSYDIAARLGGEEFALLLPDTSSIQAQGVIERLLGKFRKNVFKSKGNVSFTVTFSAGITSRWGKIHVPPKVLLAEADNAMYAAKSAGRNTIQLSAVPQENLREQQSMVRSDEKKFLFGLV